MDHISGISQTSSASTNGPSKPINWNELAPVSLSAPSSIADLENNLLQMQSSYPPHSPTGKIVEAFSNGLKLPCEPNCARASQALLAVSAEWEKEKT